MESLRTYICYLLCIALILPSSAFGRCCCAKDLHTRRDTSISKEFLVDSFAPSKIVGKGGCCQRPVSKRAVTTTSDSRTCCHHHAQHNPVSSKPKLGRDCHCGERWATSAVPMLTPHDQVSHTVYLLPSEYVRVSSTSGWQENTNHSEPLSHGRRQATLCVWRC